MELRFIDFLIEKYKQNTSNNVAHPPITEYAIYIEIEQTTTKLPACLECGCGKSFAK